MGVLDRLRITGRSERTSLVTWGVAALFAFSLVVALIASLVDGSGPYG